MKVLNIYSSIFDTDTSSGVSTMLAQRLVAGLQAADPELQIQTRDFARQPVPHLDGHWLQAISTPADQRKPEQQSKADYSDTLIRELKDAEILVIAAPMYNFSVPSMLKAWIDHIARAGVSFRYTENGPVGLLGKKKVYLLVTAGGIHEAGVSDHVRPWLKTMLGFVGLDDIEFIVAPGLNMGDAARAEGLQQAYESIDRAVADFRINGRRFQGERGVAA